MMKISFSIIFVLVFVLLLSNCNFDLYDGNRPFDYGAAKWVCDEPSAWFIINPDTDDYYSPEGEIVIDSQIIKVKFRFINQTNRVFIDLINTDNSLNNTGYNTVIEGECDFEPKKLIIKIVPEKDTLFNGKYNTITFVRNRTE